MSIAINPLIKRHLPMISIALSLLLHALVFLTIEFDPRETKPPAKKQVPIEIRTISKALSTPAITKENVPTKATAAATTPKGRGANGAQEKRRETSEGQASPAKGLAYKDLLPTASSLSVDSGTSLGTDGGQGSSDGDNDTDGNGPYHGVAYQNIMIDSHSLQGIFDIPLFLRENAESASASMELEPLSKNSVRLILLKGDPFLRAVIWEQLKNPKATQSLFRIAGAMGEKILKVSLSYSSQYASTTNLNRFAEDIKLRKARVTIVLTFNKDRDFGPQMGGMALPDEHAKLAKKRDRLATSALTESKAFQRVIRNETVTN